MERKIASFPAFLDFVQANGPWAGNGRTFRPDGRGSMVVTSAKYVNEARTWLLHMHYDELSAALSNPGHEGMHSEVKLTAGEIKKINALLAV